MAEQERKLDILAAGLAAVDTIFGGIPSNFMNVDNVIAQTYRTHTGGDAVNGAVSCARLGLKTGIACVVGDDMQGRFILDDLEKEDIDVSGVIVQNAIPTSSPVVLVEEGGERHFLRLPKSPNHIFTGTMISDETLRSARHLHIASANSLPALDGKPLTELLARAKEAGMTTSMDTNYDKAGDWLAKIKDALPLCDIFFPSLQEASIYAGSADIWEITEFFSRFGLKIFGIKLGEKGAVVTDFTTMWMAPTFFEGRPVDTTGAGDAFFAGFLAGWLNGSDLPVCLGMASAQAASVLRAVGAHTSAGTREETLALYEKNRARMFKIERL